LKPAHPHPDGTLLNVSEPKPRPGPTIIPRSDHGISRSKVSENALKVLYRLKKSGFKAFLVGGGVRDLLLGLEPKDFDIATDAHPEEVRELFRNSRLIGRRFRLAHVRFGRDVIEVATFRASGESEGEADDREHTDSGRILRDNVYGSIDEDIWRRDFTVNALYYNIEDFSVWDYTGGMDDIRSRTLRLIDDPWTRYREDPVRMLRAVRFAAKLGFEIAPDTAAPIRDLGFHLADVPAARLFDEILKLFQSGHAERSFDLLLEFGLFQYLFPATGSALEQADSEADLKLVRRGLANTDARIAEDKPVTPMFLFAVLLWPAIRRVMQMLQEREGQSEFDAMQEALNRITAEQTARIAIPRRFSVPMREILVLQRRFHDRRGARAARLLEHKRFRAAYDFLVLRGECGEVDSEVVQWWTEIQEQSPEVRSDSTGAKRSRGGRSRRGRRGRRRGGDNATSHE
jgi:poly(A) polymerase